MALFDIIKPALKVVAPTIATMLGSPLAGMAVQALSEVFFGNNKASEKDVFKRIEKASPADFVKLREKELVFSKQMADIGYDLEKLEVLGQENARQFALASLKTGRFDWQRFTFTVLAFMFLSSLVVLIISLPLNNNAKVLMSLVIGRSLGWVDACFNFFFSTTKSSAHKNYILEGQLNKTK